MTLLRGKKKDGGKIVWDSFDPYDIQGAEKRLDPEGKAHLFATSDAATEVEDDRNLTSPEIEMVADVNDHILQLSEWHTHLTGKAKDYVEILTDEVDSEFSLRKIRTTFKKEVGDSLSLFKSNVADLYIPLKNAYRRLNSFQLKHGIEDHRDATYPESPMLHFAIVIAAVFIESVMNCFFFAQGSDLGYFGGFLEALMISFTNGGLSFINGKLCLRQLNFVEKRRVFYSWFRKIMGLCGAAFFITALGCLHLLTAHYRELQIKVVDADISTVVVEVVKRFREDPLGVQDFESIVLILIGLGVTIIATWKGYTSDDRFPRYGEVYRNWRTKEDEMSGYRRELIFQIERHYHQAVQSSHEVLCDIKTARKKLENIQGDINAMLTKCHGYYEQARNGAISLLSTFRNTVQQVYNDPNVFLYDDALLDGTGGLRQLELATSKDAVETLLTDTIKAFEAMENAFPEKQADLVKELEKDQNELLDDSAIDAVVRNIQKRKEREAAHLKK